MGIKDLVDYIFVSKDDFVISNICDVPIDTLDYIPLENLKLLIKDKISDSNRLALYFKISKLYLPVEYQIAYFIEYTIYHLNNLSNIDKNIIDKVEYISLITDYYSEDYHDSGYYYFTTFTRESSVIQNFMSPTALPVA